MRNAICCFLIVLFGSWSTSLGQNAPKLTTPRIVATFQRLGKTDDIPPITIYTPKNWGTFRISIVMVLTVANGVTQSTWDGVVHFTDGAGQQGDGTFGTDVNTFVRNTGVIEFPIRAKAGLPIKFSVTSSGNTVRSRYNVWVVVEQLM